MREPWRNHDAGTTLHHFRRDEAGIVIAEQDGACGRCKKNRHISKLRKSALLATHRPKAQQEGWISKAAPAGIGLNIKGTNPL
jgi:hypothetical protein